MDAGRRITALLILSMFLITMFLYPVMAQSPSDDNGKKTLNLVIVLDRTGSLLQSDPKRLSQEAAKLIVDLMAQNRSKIGLVQYTDKVIGRLDITAINGQEEKNKLKAYIGQLGAPKGQNTDISTGLKEGVSMLAGLQNLENPVVVLLTDGKNDLKGSDRTQDISQRDLEQALATAENKRILVYTIGLNADGSVDQEMLARIAKATGGKSYIVDQANDLPDIISNVYSDALGTKLLSLGPDRIALSGNFDTYNFNVTNSSVAEANLVIYKTGDIQVKLIKPDGTEVSWDNDRFIASPAQNYLSYKILNPQQGQWRLMVKGIRNEEVKINLLYNYDLAIQMDQLSPASPSTLLGLLAAVVLGVLLLKGIPILIEKAKPKLLYGKIDLRVLNTATGQEEFQQSKTLAPYGTSVTLSKLAECSAETFNALILVRKAQGIYLSCSEAGSEGLSVSVNGDKTAPGQIVPLTNGCSLRVVAAQDSIKIEGKFSVL